MAAGKDEASGESASDQAQEESWIYLPEPEGYKRCAMVFPGNARLFVDCQLEELVERYRDFLAGDEQLLEVRDVSNGYPLFVTRKGAASVIMLETQWVKQASPERTPDNRIAVVKDLPAGMNRSQRRHGSN